MSRPWTITDFILIWLGGLAASVVVSSSVLVVDIDFHRLTVFSLVAQYAGYLGVLWLISQQREKDSLGMTVENKDVLYIGLGVLCQVAVAIAMEPLARNLFPDGVPPQQIAEAIGDPNAPTWFKLSLFVAAVLAAPIAEELIFRGALLKALQRRGDWIAIFVSAAVFSLVHILGLAPDRLLASAAVVLPPLFVFGILLGWLTVKTGRLGPAIFLHAGWNLLASIVLLLPPELIEQLEQMG